MGVKQIEERNNEADLTRPTLHIMGRHKLQCTEAAIHHTGVYIPWLIACWRNCTQWSKPLVDQPIRKVKEKRKREAERERGKIIEQKKSKHLDPTYRVGYNALINEGHQDRHAVPAKNLIWANTV